MRIQVAPAKRLGVKTTIFNAPLELNSIANGNKEEVEFSFCAAGVYDPRSKYRYTVNLSRNELEALAVVNANAEQFGDR
ncbi:hypothetical protein [Mesorhizobium xinjiangense]|uniref:hypothetical protein n=1 Tax=Mesorhizobium xinjiangense TaxID=2678685 RepID=UPI0012EEA571|nr:hypothetical protein [Mesorhizobium xinjiangense]